MCKSPPEINRNVKLGAGGGAPDAEAGMKDALV